ncbi:hypothetical protein BJV74DRAFT_47019 [Russula compacta]|nr:hypothetical protein BJV74DRAFT_47019 [Russula compacta]
MWPSLSADTLHRLHNMLLEQPHLTAQHRDILASHFGVERKHVENFIKWRVAYSHPENSPQRGHRPLPSTLTDDDIMDMDELSDPQAHLPTPAGSISPEPVYGTTPFARAQMHSRPSIDTMSPLVSGGEHRFSWPHSPGSITSIFDSYLHPHTSSPLRTTSNSAPSSQANTPVVTTHFPSPPSPEHLSRSPAKPTQFSPSSLSALPTMLSSSGDASSTTPNTGQEDSGRALAGAAPSKPPQASASPAPRTLREFEEAYAPTYARIEQFLRNVERGKYAHIGLTPEMLKELES